MMVISIKTEPALTLGDARVLFEGNYYDALGRQYDVAPDGRFLMIKPASAGAEEAVAVPQIVMVQGWFEELKRLVPLN